MPNEIALRSSSSHPSAGAYEDSLYAVSVKSIHQPAYFVNAVVRTAEQDGVAVVIRDVFDISGDIGKIMVGKVRRDDSYGLLETDSQRRCGLCSGV